MSMINRNDSQFLADRLKEISNEERKKQEKWEEDLAIRKLKDDQRKSDINRKIEIICSVINDNLANKCQSLESLEKEISILIGVHEDSQKGKPVFYYNGDVIDWEEIFEAYIEIDPELNEVRDGVKRIYDTLGCTLKYHKNITYLFTSSFEPNWGQPSGDTCAVRSVYYDEHYKIEFFLNIKLQKEKSLPIFPLAILKKFNQECLGPIQAEDIKLLTEKICECLKKGYHPGEPMKIEIKSFSLFKKHFPDCKYVGRCLEFLKRSFEKENWSVSFQDRSIILL